MKALVLVCGEGLGHTSRCIAVGNALKKAGYSIHFGAYGYSRELIERKGFDTSYIPAEVTLTGNAGALDLFGSVFETVRKFDPLFLFRFLNLLYKEKPDVVLSDSYFTGVLISEILSFPSFLILNQSNMEEFFLDKGFFGKIIGKAMKAFYVLVYHAVDGIIIPDFPMPDTICRKNIFFSKSLLKKVYYSGPLVDAKYESVSAAPVPSPHVLSTLGGFGYRKNIFLKVIEAARSSPDIYYTLLTGPSADPSDFKNVPKNVEILQFIDDQFPYLKKSDAVIIPGGHSTLMEALTFGVPILTFPDAGHNEQQNNSSAVAESGLGYCLNYTTTPETILKCIHKIVHEGKFVENSRKMKRLAASLSGADGIPGYIRSILFRKNKNKRAKNSLSHRKKSTLSKPSPSFCTKKQKTNHDRHK